MSMDKKRLFGGAIRVNVKLSRRPLTNKDVFTVLRVHGRSLTVCEHCILAECFKILI